VQRSEFTSSHEGSVSESLIRILCDTEYGDLPADVIHSSKRLIIDSVGCALGAAGFPASRIATQVAAQLGSSTNGGSASVLGTSLRVSPTAAGATNIYLGNYLDADDTYLNFSHPGVGAVFAALAFAESRRLTGQEMISAISLGYEIGCRVGRALEFVRQTRAGDLETAPGGVGWYNFCIAGAAGRALALTPQQFHNAMGMAAWTTPIQTVQFFTRHTGPGKHMLKYAPVGFHGFNAMLSAQLAANGFVAEQNIFDAPTDLWRSFGAFRLDRDRLMAKLGDSWQVTRTSFKPYACCRYGHTAIALFTRLMSRHGLQPDQISSVVVSIFTSAADRLGTSIDPQTPVDMQFSVPLAIAAAAHGSDLGPSWQNPDSINNSCYREFAERVTVVSYTRLSHFCRVPVFRRHGDRGQVPVGGPA
jgi:2-methylcitrate dehydratase PrpD